MNTVSFIYTTISGTMIMIGTYIVVFVCVPYMFYLILKSKKSSSIIKFFSSFFALILLAGIFVTTGSNNMYSGGRGLLLAMIGFFSFILLYLYNDYKYK